MQAAKKIFKLKYKVALLVLVVSLSCAGAIGSFAYITARHHVHEMMEFEYMGSLYKIKQLIQVHMNHMEEGFRLLLRLPPVSGIFRSRNNNGLIDPVDKITFQQWKQQLETIFRNEMLIKNHYIRISLIDATGMELVRVDHDNENIRVVPEGELENAFLQPYFMKFMEMSENIVDISLIQQDLDPQQPPVFRYAAALSDSVGRKRGLIVADVRAQGFLDVKKRFDVFQIKDAGRFFIADAKGAFLSLSQDQLPETGNTPLPIAKTNLKSEYPELVTEILSGQEGVLFSGEREIFYTTLRLSPTLSLAIGFDTLRRVVEAPLRQFKNFLGYVILGILCMTWSFSVLFARRILDSIHRLHSAIRRVSRGDLETNVHITSRDELQILGSGFNTMVHALKGKTNRLTGLYDLGVHITKDPNNIADKVVAFIVSVTSHRMATVERIRDSSRTIVSFFKQGGIMHGINLPANAPPCTEISQNQNICRHSRAAEAFPADPFLREHSILSYVGVPVLSSGGVVLGIVAMLDTSELEIHEEDIKLLCTLARRMAFEWETEAYINEIKEVSLETIHRLLLAAEYRDEDTGAHLQRMSHYAAAIANQMGLGKKMVEAILYAAPMHDVGKIAVPDDILLKPGKLDPLEWETMKQHTILGGKILGGSRGEFMKLAEVIALTHHERWDGTGYPKGLQGEEIPPAGRIIAIADVFDALTSKRPYKKAFALEAALTIIQEGRGTHFDPKVVDAFFAVQDEIVLIMEKYKDADL